MIASNFRRYAEALALQLPLPFAHALRRLKLARPTTQQTRTARAARKLDRLTAIARRIIWPMKQAHAKRSQKPELQWTQARLELVNQMTQSEY